MRINDLRSSVLLVALAGAGALAACGLSACGGDPIGEARPRPHDLTTVPGAMLALEDYYSRRLADEAIALLAPAYRFVPALPDSIPFLPPGETSWGYDREVEILEELLVEERTSWIDQVLLEYTPLEVDTLPDQSIEVTADTDLLLLIGADQFRNGQATMVLVYRRNLDGNYLLHEERETLIPTAVLSVGEQKAGVLTGP